jgi:hypothetical protein
MKKGKAKKSLEKKPLKLSREEAYQDIEDFFKELEYQKNNSVNTLQEHGGTPSS